MSAQHSAFERSRPTRPRFRIQMENQENECPNTNASIPCKRSSVQSSASEVAKIQEKNIAILKERFNQLRAANTASKAEARMKVIDLQKKIAAAQNRQKTLKKQIAEHESGIDSQAKEEMAADVIEDIWNELQNFRGEIRSKIDIKKSHCSCASDNDDIESIANDDSVDVSSIIPSIDDCTVQMTPVVTSSPALSPMIDETTIISDSPMPETPRRRNRKKVKITETPDFEGSIASRRTPRRGKDVYYKEPSMKEALSPDSPFVFTLGEERSTPTLPNGYVRSPIQKKKKR